VGFRDLAFFVQQSWILVTGTNHGEGPRNQPADNRELRLKAKFDVGKKMDFLTKGYIESGGRGSHNEDALRSPENGEG